MIEYVTEENEKIYRNLPVLKAEDFDGKTSESRKINLDKHSCESDCR